MRCEVILGRRWIVRALVLIAVVVVFPSIAEAANCRFASVWPPSTLAFGTYSPFGSFLDGSMSFLIGCSAKATPSLQLSSGSSSTYFPRTMTSGTNTLPYNLYVDSGRSIVWGDGTAGTAEGGSETFFNLLLVTVYGRIAAGMDSVAGAYTDTINIRLYVDGVFDDDANFQVTANVSSECTVESFNLDFGNYDPAGVNAASSLDGTTSVQAYCTKGTNATISLSPGSNYSGGTRRMSGPVGEYLRYNIFTDVGRTVEWNGVNTVSLTSTSKTLPLGGAGGVAGYGRIPPGENVLAGDYSDTVVATVDY